MSTISLFGDVVSVRKRRKILSHPTAALWCKVKFLYTVPKKTEMYMKRSDAKASKCLKSSKMSIFNQAPVFMFTYFTYISHENKHSSLIKMLILDDNFRRHLNSFASELFIHFIQKNHMKFTCTKTRCLIYM